MPIKWTTHQPGRKKRTLFARDSFAMCCASSFKFIGPLRNYPPARCQDRKKSGDGQAGKLTCLAINHFLEQKVQRRTQASANNIQQPGLRNGI